MAQLVERSLPISEVRGSNPVIGKNLYRTFTVNCIEKTKIKKKRPGNAHFLKDLCFEKNENKQKEAGIGPFLKTRFGASNVASKFVNLFRLASRVLLGTCIGVKGYRGRYFTFKVLL